MPEPKPIRSDEDMGLVLRDRRKALKMSQETLSALTGIAQPNISSIERGRGEASLTTYLKVCVLLGIDLKAVPRS